MLLYESFLVTLLYLHMPNYQLFTAMSILMYVQGHNQKFYNKVWLHFTSKKRLIIVHLKGWKSSDIWKQP